MTAGAGALPIDKLKPGDKVYARNEQTGEQSYHPVTQTFATPNDELYNLTLATTSGKQETLGVTGNHPFWVKDKGWTESDLLKTGMQVAGKDGGWLTVVGLALRVDKATGYNLEVEGDHSYFVGDNGAWVHNECLNNAQFRNSASLNTHYEKHIIQGNEYGQQFSLALYEKRAQQFFSRPINDRILEYTRVNGDIVRVSSQTGEFGIISPSTNTIRTLFRPATSKVGNGVDPVQYFLNDRFKNLGY